jgi:glycosyltransferase involved in cell wall biosynthesis
VAKFEKRVDVAAVRSKWHVGPGEKLVTAVGRLTSQKGFDDLIRAYPKIRRSVPNARFLVVGDGYMRGELEALAEREEVKGATTFAGFVSDPDLVDAVKASDVIVVPSRFEPFGIIALEAMAAGVPVVVSKVGGLAEIVDDSVDGLEVEPNNPDSIADATARVLSDRALASELAAKAKEKVTQFSWESSAMKTLGAYEEARRESKYE